MSDAISPGTEGDSVLREPTRGFPWSAWEIAGMTSVSDRQKVAEAVCPSSPLDLGIAREVALLIARGVETFEACQGGNGHAYDRPTVRFHGGPGAGWHALGVCRDFDIPVHDIGRVWDVIEGEPSGPYWQIVFRPTTNNGGQEPAG